MWTQSPNCQAKKMTLQMSLEIEILHHIMSVTLLAPCSGISALIHNRSQTWHTIWFSLHFEHTKVFAAEKSGFGLYAQCLIVACGRLALSRPAATFTMSSKLGPKQRRISRARYRSRYPFFASHKEQTAETYSLQSDSHLTETYRRCRRILHETFLDTVHMKCADVVHEVYAKHS